MPPEKFEDFLELFAQQLVKRSRSSLFIGQISVWCAKNQTL